jgi:hypothetical protein
MGKRVMEGYEMTKVKDTHRIDWETPLNINLNIYNERLDYKIDPE